MVMRGGGMMVTGLMVVMIMMVPQMAHGSPALEAHHRAKRAACDTAPCMFGTPCTEDANGGYTCECGVAYYGKNCEYSCGKADVSYIIDSSGSIKTENWPGVINFFRNLTIALNVGQDSVRIGAVRYGDTGQMVWPLKACDDHQCVLDKLDNDMTYKAGSTNTSGAFFVTWNDVYSQASGNRSKVKDVCILFTDGKSNTDDHLTIPYANELKARGCALFVVAIGPDSDLNLQEIDEMGSEPKLNFTLRTETRDFDALINHVQPIVQQTCLESQKSDPCGVKQPCQRGAVCTNVDPNAGTYSCDCPDPFNNQPNCDGVACNPVDLCFIVDGSGSVGAANWPKVLEFLNDAVDAMPIGDSLQVGFVIFSTDATLTSAAGILQTKADLLNHINNNMLYPQGITNTDQGLQVARSQCLANKRAGAEQVVFVVTDGMAADETKLKAELDVYKNKDIELFSIGFGPLAMAIKPQLELIATDSANSVIVHTDISTLASRAVDLVVSLCGARPCQSNPCQNGGVCRYAANDPAGNNNGYTCECPNQYITGTHCETLNYCSPNPCKNGGSCQENVNGPVCVCPTQWTGPTCSDVECGKANVCFVVDGSFSVGAADWLDMEEMLVEMVDLLDISQEMIHVGVIQFSSTTKTELTMGSTYDKNVIASTLRAMVQQRMGTETQLGLQDALNVCFNDQRSGAKKITVLITDGKARNDTLVQLAAENLLNAGVSTYVLAYGMYIGDVTFLSQINTITQNIQGHQFIRKTVQELKAMSLDITQSFCEPADFCAGSPCANGGQCVNGATGFTCVCPGSLPGPRCVDPCSTSPCPSLATCQSSGANYQCLCPGNLVSPNCDCPETDVCLVVDSSLSVSELEEWPKIQLWASGLVDQFNSKVEIGLVVFSTMGETTFNMRNYTDKDSAKFKLRNMKYGRGGTNTVDGLKKMKNECFVNGRSSAQKWAIVLTDGNYRNEDELVSTMNNVKAASINTVTIGWRYATDKQLLEMSQNQQDRVFKIGSVDELVQLSPLIDAKFCYST